jgi:hypothetical protein
MLRWIESFFRWGEHVKFGSDLVEIVIGFFGWKKTIAAAVAALIAGVEAWRENLASSPLALAIVGLVVLILVLLCLNLFLWLRRLLKERREMPATSLAASEARLQELGPDIDARKAFFLILEKSEWRDKQLQNSPDPRTARSDWLKIRLETDIHNYLAQEKIAAWGEVSLPRGTGPLRQISADKWDAIEILFDNINPNVPRTIAKWRNGDRVSHFGIMFSKKQIFELFPLSAPPSLDRIPVTTLLKIAVDLDWRFSPDSLHLIDMQDAIRQGALDETLTVWGRLNRWSDERIVRDEVLEKIPSIHWREFRVSLYPAFDGDNFHVKSWSPNEKLQGYLDLHVERGEAISWLKIDAVAFKGKARPR